MMSDTAEFYGKIEEKFVSWAETVDDVRAAFIVGSRARRDHPADEWSDMDIVFYTSNQNHYLSTNEWLNNFGDVRTSFATRTAGGDSECLTLFDGGWQVDFVVQTTDDLNCMVASKIIPGNFHRGVKVLVDKDHIARNIVPACNKAPQGNPLSEESCWNLTNMFWFIALYMAKQILRNELWVVKARDQNLKEILLQMIEWHEKTAHGMDYDTWHTGRFLCEWSSADTRQELRNTFGRFDGKDSWEALMATIALFRRLSHDIAGKRGFPYPDRLEETVCRWIDRNKPEA